MVIIQPSAARTTTPLAPFPSSKLLGYYHSSALRTDKSTFWAKPAAVSTDSGRVGTNLRTRLTLCSPPAEVFQLELDKGCQCAGHRERVPLLRTRSCLSPGPETTGWE